MYLSAPKKKEEAVDACNATQLVLYPLTARLAPLPRLSPARLSRPPIASAGAVPPGPAEGVRQVRARLDLGFAAASLVDR